MTTQEIADSLVSHCAAGDFHTPVTTHYAADVVSVEPFAQPGGSRESHGLDAVIAKGEWWVSNHEIHSMTVEGPLVAGSFFSVVFRMDVTHKPNGQRFQMDEVAVYQVADGKIVREEFFYAM